MAHVQRVGKYFPSCGEEGDQIDILVVTDESTSRIHADKVRN